MNLKKKEPKKKYESSKKKEPEQESELTKPDIEK